MRISTRTRRAAGRWAVSVLGLWLATTAAASAADLKNLLRNADFEAGRERPEGWKPFVPRRAGREALSFSWDGSVRHGGRRSVRIEARDAAPGMWQQVVGVTPGTIYRVTGWVRLGDVRGPRSGCRLQLVFRGADGRIVQFVNLPTHRGSTDWMYDLPHPILVRAPRGSAKVEVNLYIQGSGTAWFDDVFFGPAPTGTVRGTVTCDGSPVAGAEVALWGTPFAARTGARGRYALAGVPVASPRYILLARKPGHNTRPAGDIAVRQGQTTPVDLELPRGDDRFNVLLRVKFASLRRCEAARPNEVAEDAVIDPKRYPRHVRVYLQASECIDSDHSLVRKVAAQILSGVPADQRSRTRAVAWAVFQWVIRNVEFDTTYDTQGRNPGTNFTDVTSGKWQTITPGGWCWGHNFTDWLYKPSEALRERRGICIEHSRLATALLRAVGIPARPMKPYQAQFWVQRPSGEGYWSAMSTNGGRAAYRDRGETRSGFGRLAPSSVHIYPLDAGPIVHSDWRTDNKCLWREVHPWRAEYRTGEAAGHQALADMAEFSKTGEDPRRTRRTRRPRPGRRSPDQGGREPRELLQMPPSPREDRTVVAYSDFTLNLSNIGSQRVLQVRFPFPLAGRHVTYDPKQRAFWTNRPEWVKRTWVSRETPPPGSGVEGHRD